MSKSGLTSFFALDDHTARLLVEKCFAPMVVERAFNLQVCETTEDAWHYEVPGASSGVVAVLPRKYSGSVSDVAQAVKSMASALGQQPMFLLIALVSGAAILSARQKIAEEFSDAAPQLISFACFCLSTLVKYALFNVPGDIS